MRQKQLLMQPGTVWPRPSADKRTPTRREIVMKLETKKNPKNQRTLLSPEKTVSLRNGSEPTSDLALSCLSCIDARRSSDVMTILIMQRRDGDGERGKNWNFSLAL